MGRARRYTDVQFTRAVAESRSIRQLLSMLGLQAAGGNYEMAHRRIASLGLSTTHFHGPGWRRGSSTPVVPRVSLDDLLVDARPTQSSRLRARLIEAGLKKAECEECLGSLWNDRPMPLELDHVNGRREDNRLSNLRLLCPNCHAQTSTYRGRNIGKGRAIL